MRRMRSHPWVHWRSACLTLLALLALTLGACGIPGLSPAASHATQLTPSATHSASKIPAGWKTFLDPEYGFTISFPPDWTLAPGYNGSHITLYTTNVTFSPLITLDTRSPAAVLAQASGPGTTANQGGQPTHRTVAGQPALDFFTAYTPPTGTLPPGAAVPVSATRLIMMAVRNDAGTTNVYSFLAYIATDAAGHVSAAASADNQMIGAILATFTLPTPIPPAPAY